MAFTKRNLRAEALERWKRGDPLHHEDRELLSAFRTLPPRPEWADPVDPIPFQTPEGSVARTPERNGTMDPHAFAQWVLSLPDELRELLERQVEEPEVRTFSHRMVQRMAMQGASDVDIATLIGIEKSLLVLEAREALELGRTIFRFMLTHRQFGAGMSGDKTMLVWLGKQKLGQMERAVTEITGANGGPIEISESARLTRAKLQRILEDARGTEIAQVVAPVWKSLPATEGDDDATDG